MEEATNEASLDHQIPQTPFANTIGKYVDESVYRAIGTRLSRRENYCDNWTKYSQHWNKATVRLYTLLRMLGFHDGDSVFKWFESENVDDFWLPLNTSILRKIESEALPAFNSLEFAKTQSYVMSDAKQMDEENLVRPFFARQYHQEKQKSQPKHRCIEHGIDHFADMGQIGKGSSAHVRHFRHEDSGNDSGRDFACKRLLRVIYANLESHRNQLECFKKEIEALSRLEYHPHIVGLVASFTDLESFSLILYPIADKVLLDLLKQTDPLSDQDFATLRSSFNCLATALEFLHANSIRHKDIKPSNILLSGGRVLLCDFGISHRWTDSENGTTEGGYSSFTHRYAAPEVLRVDARRNSKADIWSLGCVFLEILSVTKGCSYDQIMNGRGLSYSLVQDHDMATWPQKINLEPENTEHQLPMGWISLMIRHDPKQRPDAGTLVNQIHADAIKTDSTATFLASCCRRVEAEPVSQRSDNLMQNVTSYPGSHTSKFIALDSSSARSRRHGSLVSSRSESSSVPVRTSSIASNPETPLPFRATQARSSLGTAPASVVFSKTQTPVTTPGTSVRSNSDLYEPLTVRRAAVEAPSDETSHQHRIAWPITHGSPCGIRGDETLLFTNSFVQFSIAESATVKRYSQCCDAAENTVQIFETTRMNNDAPIWEITRRIVFSDFTPTRTRRICYSFWLPLTNLDFSRISCTVTLRWSDCNHPRYIQDSTQSYGGHWSWVYDPAVANNEVCIQFGDEDAAREFIDFVRFPRDGGSMLEVSHKLEIHTWQDDNLPQKKMPFVVTQHEGTASTSRLYVVGRYIDLLIRYLPQDHQFNIQLDQIECLIYLSNLRNQTSKGRRIARFERAKLMPSSLSISIPLVIDIGSPLPPESLTTLFQRLTGWELLFFAAEVHVDPAQRRIVKSLVHKTFRKQYGVGSVLLWRKDSEGVVSGSLTFLFPGVRKLWRSGRISTLSSEDHESKDAVFTFNLLGNQRGTLLDTTCMMAIPDVAINRSESGPGDQQELRRFKLRFQDLNQRQVFEGIFEKLARSVSEIPRLRTGTSLATGSLIPGTPFGR